MKLKRLFTGVLSAVMLMSAIALPASAATGSGEMYASLNGGPTVSNTSVRNHLLEATHIPRSPIPAVAGVLRGMNGFISVAEVRAEPKQPGFITVHTMVAQLPVQCRTFLGMEPWVLTTNWLLSMTTITRTSMLICM